MSKQQLLALLAVILLVGFTALGINNLRNKDHKIQLQEVQLLDRKAQLKSLELQYKDLNQKLDVELKDKTTTKERIEQLEKEKADLEAERIRLEGELQAKLQRKEAERIAQAQARLVDTVTNTKPAQAAQAPSRASYVVTGNKQTWLQASGIPASEWWAVDLIVQRESGWNPCAYNPGRSDCNANPTSACGLAQSLPCGKQSVYGHWTDPVANLKWQYDYVRGRYGGYAQAVAFWDRNHWY